jgi:hypothetical protein
MDTLWEPPRSDGRNVSDPIVVIDSSEIREGRLEDLKAALKELVEFVEASEAEPIAHNIYFNEDGTRMTVVQIHPISMQGSRSSLLLSRTARRTCLRA